MCFIDTVNKYHAKALCSHAKMKSAPCKAPIFKGRFSQDTDFKAAGQP